MKKISIALSSTCVTALALALSACSSPSSAPEKEAVIIEQVNPYSHYRDSDLCGLTIQMDAHHISRRKQSSGENYEQYIYSFGKSEFVSQLVFHEMGLSDAMSKTFGDDCKSEEELYASAPISIGGLPVEVMSGTNANGGYTFAYACGDDGYGFALGFKGNRNLDGQVDDGLIDYILETAAFETSEAMTAIPPNDGKVEVAFSDGGVLPNGKTVGGSILKRERVELGGSATPPDDPSLSGYLFKGWKGEYTNVQADTVITAEWEEIGGTEIGAALLADTKSDLINFANDFVAKQLSYKGDHDFIFPDSYESYDFYSLGHGNGMAPEGSTAYRVVGHVDLIDRNGAAIRRRFWVLIDYTMMDRSCHLNESKIGYDE